MSKIIFPWTLKKRKNELKLIPEFKQTDLFKNLEASLNEPKINSKNEFIWSVEHIRKNEEMLQAYISAYMPGNALPYITIHFIRLPNKQEIITTINYQIDNEYDRIKIDNNIRKIKSLN